MKKFTMTHTMKKFCLGSILICAGAVFSAPPAPPAPTISFSPASVTYTVGQAVSLAPAKTGAIVSCTSTPALPAGLLINNTTCAITGAPVSVSASTLYTFTATNGSGSGAATLNIAVVDQPPANLKYSTNPAVYSTYTAIANNTPSVKGVVTGYSVSPPLPAGLTLDAGTGVISGTPTVAAAAANYTVTARNSGGATTATVTITVNFALQPPSNLGYSSNPAVYTVGIAIPNNTPTVSGTVTGYSVKPALPAGLILNTSTGVISGTPTGVKAAANYVVTGSNSAGSTTAAITLTVNAALQPPSNLRYSSNPAVYTVGVATPDNTPTVSGTVTGYSVNPALPAGLMLNTTTGVISGTPTAAMLAANYIVTCSNSAGSTTAAVLVTVNAALQPPSNLSYSSNLGVYTVGDVIPNNTPTVSGTVTDYSVNPALPAGLILNTSTGVISGTPTQVNPATNYTVTGSNAAGSTTTTINIIVNAGLQPPNLGYSSNAVVYTVGIAIPDNAPTVSGTVTDYSVFPALPDGLTLNTSTGVISGVPQDAIEAEDYTVTGANSVGWSSAIINITVNAALQPPSALSYSSNPAMDTVGIAISNITPTVSGTVMDYSVSPALPSGLILNTSTGVISGVPEVESPAANYRVFASNGAGVTWTDLSITVMTPQNATALTALRPASSVPDIRMSGSSVLFSLPPTTSGVRISVIDIQGRELWHRTTEAGTGMLSWEGKSSDGQTLATGIYMVRVTMLNNQKKSADVWQRKFALMH